LLNESLLAFREIFVRNRQSYYAENISRLKLGFANASAEQTFLPNVSKYIIEISVTLGAVVVAAIQFSTQDAPRAAASLALFIAAGSRIAPALLRIQQSLIQMQSNIGGSKPTLDLIEELKDRKVMQKVDEDPGVTDEFNARLEFRDVSFIYNNSNREVLTNISFKVEPGEFIAIVGASGSGKSTLVDLLLGLLQPTSGSISLSGKTPRNAIKQWPNAISYVPQTVAIFGDSIINNIGLGFSTEDISEARVKEVVKLSQLEEVVGEFSQGINKVLGERGHNLSGGQIQRVGIARALYNGPNLLVLDEATSSLDSKTESEITEMILKLKGQLTLVVVAHRLSTIKNADRVIFLNEGKIQASGTFAELRASVPDFEMQANSISK
jgi:ABC-type multidrug transport system fused ATPase/permease subunit